ncbi:MAG: nickel pincer cofactor biosynthesis protein LarC, partial [bacterium]|nr:nickel pincer cofactor biosynthesis protein LarC [bacterium]
AETHKHRHLSGILEMIEAADLPGAAADRAGSVFERLAEAEAGVHGVAREQVHFHEVGAADSIADIVGACLGFELLGIEAVFCSAINVGSGAVNTEHGVLPVPAPATAALLVNRPIYSRGPATELTTPTGAAIATALAESFGPPPAMHLLSTGHGAGSHDFAEHANVLRVLVGEATGANESATVSVIEANIDDSTPEVLGYAMDRLLDAGALDVSLSPLLMKKNRLGTLLRVIARPENQESLAQLALAETSSLGVRIYSAERRVEARDIVEVETPHGKVRVKVSQSGGFAPEYEDCRKLATSTGTPLRQILAEASHAYLESIQ